MLYGDSDPYVPQNTPHNLADSLGIIPTIVHNGGDMNTDVGFTSYPNLLKIATEIG